MSAPGPAFVGGGVLAMVAWLLAALLLAPPNGYSTAGLWVSTQWCGAIYIGVWALTELAGGAPYPAKRR